ncbi:unnamed protein product, partial [Mesorhabditis belari]|uniref:C2H2-type domain-containing protein n=1 Tax=Mesorhabditis belari TaxID=2138241 RepID=A0AAF3F4C6_9BILA
MELGIGWIWELGGVESKEFCNKYYLATHRAAKHTFVAARVGDGHSSFGMLQSHLPDFAGLRADMANASNASGNAQTQLDLNQLVLASLDPSTLANNPLRSLYMSQLAQISGGSPSPASSAPSSASESQPTTTHPTSHGDATPPATESAQASAQSAPQMPNWFQQALLPQQAALAGLPAGMSTLLEQMSGGLPGLNPMALAAALAGGAPPMTPNTAASLFGQMATSPQKEAMCTICDKSFCNRFFLKTHMEKKHGLILDETSSPQKTTSPLSGSAFPFLPPSTSAGMPTQSVIVNGNEEGTPRKLDRMETDEDEAEAAHKSSVDFLLASMRGTLSSCDECGRDFPTVFEMIAHKAREHPNDKENPFIRCGECSEMFDSAEALQQHATIAHTGITRQLLSGLLPPGFPSLPFLLPQGMPPQFAGLDALDPTNLAMLQQGVSPPKSSAGSAQKRTYASNGKNYCDLCNKEVCNKYFLRTHMLKMHGIVIDENKLVISNIDTVEKERMGGITFRCDICLVELKSRQLLRQHKQETHGVAPLSTPQRPIKPPQPTTPTLSTPTLTLNGTPSFLSEALFEKCVICEKRVHPATLSQHMANEHPADLPAHILAQLKSFQPQTPEIVSCRYCPARFKEESESQLHMITQHAAELLAATADELKKEEGVERCPQCPYQTKNARNLEIHMERHERLNEIKGDDDDDALKITQEVALKMAELNKFTQPFTSASLPKPELKVKCDFCNRIYSNQDALTHHKQTIHQFRTKMRPSTQRALRKLGVCFTCKKARFPCRKCSKRCWTQEEHLKHFVTHLGVSKHEKVEKIDGGSRTKEEHTVPHVEGHSHTSGSVSPSGASLPEGFARPTAPASNQSYVMQSFVLRENPSATSGAFPNELLCHLPVRTPLSGSLSVTFDVIPHTSQPSPTGYPI